jgi:hypothetical protein
MEPLILLCRLKCPESGEKAYVDIELAKDEGCRVTGCTILGDGPVTCSLGCLEGTVAG